MVPLTYTTDSKYVTCTIYPFHVGTRVSMTTKMSMVTRVSVTTSVMLHSTVLPDTSTTVDTTTDVSTNAAFPVLAAAVGGGGGALIAIVLALIVVIVVVFVVRRRGRGKIRTVDSEQEMHVYSGKHQTRVCSPRAHCNIGNMCSSQRLANRTHRQWKFCYLSLTMRCLSHTKGIQWSTKPFLTHSLMKHLIPLHHQKIFIMPSNHQT